MAKQVTAGEKFRFSARTYNDVNQLMENNRMSGVSMQAKTLRSNNDFVYVKNTSAAGVSRYGILGISGIVFDPQTALPAFTSRVVFEGAVPAEDAYTDGRFVICAEPIRPGGIGRAWADGIVITKISVSDEAHVYASLKDGDASQLESSQTGLCTILWKESGTGTKWAVIRFGAGSGNGLRIAYIKENGPYNLSYLQAYLDKNITGDLVNVYFTLLGGATSIQEGHYTFCAGVPIPVMLVGDRWKCIVPLQGTELCMVPE